MPIHLLLRGVPALWFFILMIFGLTYWRVLDFLKIPKSTFTHGIVISNSNVIMNGTSPPKRSTRIGELSGRWYYYHLIVEFDNRQAVTFVVSRKVHRLLSVGSKGVVEHVDKHFRKFHVDKTLAEMVNPDKKNHHDFKKGFKKNQKSNNKNKTGTEMRNRYRDGL